MKKLMTVLSVFAMSLMAQAQDEVLQKYTEMGDVNTSYVSKRMLSELPAKAFDMPGLSGITDKIEYMKVLVSRGDKVGKQMGTKLPKQLESAGFKPVVNTVEDGQSIQVLQSKKDPTLVVVIVYVKPQATVVSMKGDFSDWLPSLGK